MSSTASAPSAADQSSYLTRIPLLTNTPPNFNEWSLAMSIHLRSEFGDIGSMVSTKVVPEYVAANTNQVNASLKAKYITNAAKATAEIMKHLSPASYRLVSQDDTFAEVWNRGDVIAVWNLVEKHHKAVQTSQRALQVAMELRALKAMKMGASEDIDSFNYRYQVQVDKLTYLEYSLRDAAGNEAIATMDYLTALYQPVYGDMIALANLTNAMPVTLATAKAAAKRHWETKSLMGPMPTAAVATGTVLYSNSGRKDKKVKKEKEVRKEKHTSNAATPHPNSKQDGGKWCILHHTASHDSSECNKLKAMIDKEKPNGGANGGGKKDKTTTASGRCGIVVSARAAIAKEYALVLDSAASHHIMHRSVPGITDIHNIDPVNVIGVDTSCAMIIRKAGTHPTLGTVLVSNDVTANLVSLQAARSHFHVHFDDVNNKFELTGKVHGVQYVFTCTDGIFVTNTTAANPATATANVHASTATATTATAPPTSDASTATSNTTSISTAPAAASNTVLSPGNVSAAATSDSNTAATIAMKTSASPEMTVAERQRAQEARALHIATGHPSDPLLKHLLDNNILINCHLTGRDVDNAARVYGECVACAQGKVTHVQVSPTQGEPATKVGQQVSIDLYFLKVSASEQEQQRYMVAIDNFSGYLFSCRVNSKDTIDTISGLSRLLQLYKQHQHVITTLVSDREGSMMSSQMDSFLANNGIQLTLSTANGHSPHAERVVRVIKERLRAITCSLPYVLPAYLYHYLVQHIVDTINILPNTHSGSTSCPTTIFTRKKPDYALMCSTVSFGAVVLVRKPYVDALLSSDSKGDIGIALGLDGYTRNAIKFYSLQGNTTKAITVRTQPKVVPLQHLAVQLFGSNPNYVGPAIAPQYQPAYDVSAAASPAMPATPTVIPLADAPIVVPPMVTPSASIELVPTTPNITPSVDASIDAIAAGSDVLSEVSADAAPTLPQGGDSTVALPAPPQGGVRRSSRVRTPTIRNAFAYNMTIKQATAKHHEVAVEAVKKEMQQMIDYCVFEPLYERDCMGKHIIPSKPFLKEKVDAKGNITQLKCRFVAGGHREIITDSTETAAHTGDIRTEMCLLDIANRMDHHLAKLDVRAAYLNARLPSEILMRISKEVVPALLLIKPDWKIYVCTDGSMIVKLLKALYGLRESALCWYNELYDFMVNTMKYVQSAYDPCLYTYRHDNVTSHVVVHVDDLLVSSNSSEHMEELQQQLRDKFKDITVDSGDEFSYLGMLIKRDRKARTLQLSQESFIKQMLVDYEINDTANAPAISTLCNLPPGDRVNAQKFRSLVMKMMYCSTRTRPDTLFPVSYLATFSNDPRSEHMTAAYHVLKYLNGTPNLCKTFRATASELKTLEVYADASYATHQDSKSHSGFCVYTDIDSACIYSRSVKQKYVTRSSTDAEVGSMDIALQSAAFIRGIYNDLLSYELDVVIHQDNQSAIHMVQHGVNATTTTKHIGVRINYLHQEYADKVFVMTYTSTDKMIADSLTKPLTGEKFYHFRNVLLSCNKQQ